MSQIGMQMPGAGSRRAGPNVYTGLLFATLVALISACVYMGLYALPSVGKDGEPFALQEPGKISIKETAPPPAPTGGGRGNTPAPAPKPAEGTGG